MAALRELLLNSVKALRVKFTPSGSISSENVQDALEEIDGTISALTASDISIPQVNSPTNTTLQDWLDNTQSSGLLSGGGVTDNGDGSVTVAAGEGFIKDTSDVLSNTSFFKWDENDNLTLIDSGSINWIYIDYTASVVSAKTTSDFSSINWATQFIIAVAYRSGTDICIQDLGSRRFNLANRIALREYDLWGYTRSDGLVLSETGTLNAYVTSGHFYALYTKVSLSTIDTSGTDRICYWYRDGIGGWTKTTDIATFNNTQYDDGDGTPGTLGVGKYNTLWCFLSLDGKLNIVLGRLNTGVLATAQAEALYADLPDFINTFTFLTAKVIVQEGQSSVTEIDSAYEVTIQTAQPTDHNGLANLNAGDYLHLTATEYGGVVFGDKEIKTTIAVDTLWTDIIPAGYLLELMTLENSTANQAVLSLGTSDGDNDVFTGQVMEASGITTVVINKYFSSSTATSLDLNDDQSGDSWNSASFTVTLLMRKMTA